jgi:hypothetical protein
VDAPTGEWKSEVVVIVKTVGPVHDVAVIHGFLVIAAASKVSEARNRLPSLGVECSAYFRLEAISKREDDPC